MPSTTLAIVLGILGLIFILSLVFKKGVFGKVRAFAGGFGLPVQISLAILAGIMLLMGGLAGLSGLWGSIGNVASGQLSDATATLTGNNAEELPPVTLGSCTLSTISATAPARNVSYTADPNDKQRYKISAKENAGGTSVNGTLSCDRGDTSNIQEDVGITCWARADEYRSETSTTDSNTYYIVQTSTSKSEVPGYPWAQNIYLKDNGVASSTDKQEKVTLVFAEGVATRTLGFYFDLAGATEWGYLNNQSTESVEIVCGQTYNTAQDAFEFEITKVAGVEALGS